MKEIALDNNWTYCHYVGRDNTGSGAPEPAEDLANLEAWLSATHGGAEIHADLRKAMAERADTPGEYFAIVTGDVLREHLTDDEDEPLYDVVYEVFGTGDSILCSFPRRLLAVRTA